MPSAPHRPIFLIGLKNSVYYTAIWVPLTMAVGLFLAVIVNQKIRGQTFFRAAFYFPAIASSAAITVLWIFLLQPDGLFNEVRGAMGINPLFQALGYEPNQNWFGDYRTRAELGHRPERLDHLRARSCSSTSPRSSRSATRSTRRRRSMAPGLAGVLEHHVPAAQAGPFLRGHGA